MRRSQRSAVVFHRAAVGPGFCDRRCLAALAAVYVGVNLLELDALAHRMITDAGGESCYIDYHPSFGASAFGKVLCTSVNDAVLHGLPHDYALKDGDLLSVDFAASLDGWVSDSAISFVVRELVDPSRCTSTLASPGCTTTPSCEIDICESSSPIVHDSPVCTLRAT